MAKMNPVGWFEIYVQDIDRAQKFYEAVLGVSLTDLPTPGTDQLKMKVFTPPGENAMERPGSTGTIVHMPGFPSGGNSPAGADFLQCTKLQLCARTRCRQRADHDVIPIRITKCELHVSSIGIHMRLLFKSADECARPWQRVVEIIDAEEEE